ncbi:hypothetical protein AB4304_13885 [Vibrio breoganii]
MTAKIIKLICFGLFSAIVIGWGSFSLSKHNYHYMSEKHTKILHNNYFALTRGVKVYPELHHTSLRGYRLKLALLHEDLFGREHFKTLRSDIRAINILREKVSFFMNTNLDTFCSEPEGKLGVRTCDPAPIYNGEHIDISEEEKYKRKNTFLSYEHNLDNPVPDSLFDIMEEISVFEYKYVYFDALLLKKGLKAHPLEREKQFLVYDYSGVAIL